MSKAILLSGLLLIFIHRESTAQIIKSRDAISGNQVDEGPPQLPDRYFWLMEKGCRMAEEKMDAFTNPTLDQLESDGWRWFPYTIMASSVLYAKKHPANKFYRKKKMLELSIRIGDLMASENELGIFESRFGAGWDTYMWLEAYRLLQNNLGQERRERWKREILKIVKPMEEYCELLKNTAWYDVPFLNTSSNHHAINASLLFLASKIFGIKSWEKIGATVLHRFAVSEISPDGFWGEHNHLLPTTGYNYLTLSAVALYCEHSKDPAVLPALKKATNFHKYFTYPDGTPVEVINDRNRFWEINPWGNFGFSHFPDGRRYAQFIAGLLKSEDMVPELTGRIAQDALYYHKGPLQPIPQDMKSYHFKMSVDAGIRKNKPWIVAYSGLMATQAVNNTFFLDRQGNLSIFHEKLGLIITGANSKRQPELATFSEKIDGQVYHLPINSRLQMSDTADRLSLAFNTFFADAYVPKPVSKELKFRFVINGKGTPSEETKLNLQLCFKAGEILETANGKKIVLGKEKVKLSSEEVGGWIRHHGWTLKMNADATLTWPFYPHNPYANGPETKLEKAVGILSIPLILKEDPKHYVRVNEKIISFILTED